MSLVFGLLSKLVPVLYVEIVLCLDCDCEPFDVPAGLTHAEATLSFVIVNAARRAEASVSPSSSLTVTAGSCRACPAGTDEVVF